MFRLRLTIDCQPRTKNGQPPQSTTGAGTAEPVRRPGVLDAPTACLAGDNVHPADRVLARSRRSMRVRRMAVLVVAKVLPFAFHGFRCPPPMQTGEARRYYTGATMITM